LCHRSGLPAYDEDGCSWANFANRAELAAHLRNVKPNAKFREKWQYSNTMYALAAYVLESISGMPWDVFVQRYVIDPCGLHNTYFFASSIPAAANASLAYEFDRVSYAIRPVDYNKNFYRWVAPAGSMHSNVLDMAQWAIMNLQSKGINAEIHKPQISIADDATANYCFGWIKTSDGMIWHNGGTAGCSALVVFSPNKQTGIVILSNINDVGEFNNLLKQYAQTYIDDNQAWLGKRWYQKICGKIARYACERSLLKAEAQNIPHKVASIDPTLLEKYLGNYKFSENPIITITKDGDKIFAQITGQERYQMLPESEKKFFFALVDAQISFVGNENGKITHLILHQDGENQVAERINNLTD
jgi:hypothetical protein